MRLLLDLQGAQGSSRHSGLGRYSLEFARALAATRGEQHEVLLLLNAAQSASAALLEAEFTPLLGADRIHHFTAPEGCAAGADPHHPLRQLAEHIRAQAILALAPDMVHLGSVFEGWNDQLVTNWPAALPRPRHVATLHDLIPLTRRAEYLEGPWRDAGLVPWYMRQLLELRGMDGLLCNSEATRQEGLAHLDMAPGQLVRVGGGVAAPFFAPQTGPAPVAGRYILCLGLNDIRKNEARLIAAIGLLPPNLRDGLRLVVTGTIPAEHLQRLAREAGLAEGTILHLGMVEDAALPALYAHAALFVLPSLAEGFGLPLAEAMAAGAPFAASHAGALPELAGRQDVLFDPLDITDMARVMGQVLGDAGLAQALRRWGPGQGRGIAGWTAPGAAGRRWRAGPARRAPPCHHSWSPAPCRPKPAASPITRPNCCPRWRRITASPWSARAGRWKASPPALPGCHPPPWPPHRMPRRGCCTNWAMARCIISSIRGCCRFARRWRCCMMSPCRNTGAGRRKPKPIRRPPCWPQFTPITATRRCWPRLRVMPMRWPAR